MAKSEIRTSVTRFRKSKPTIRDNASGTLSHAVWVSRPFIASLLVVMWLVLIITAYLSQFVQPACLLFEIPLLCSP